MEGTHSWLRLVGEQHPRRVIASAPAASTPIGMHSLRSCRQRRRRTDARRRAEAVHVLNRLAGDEQAPPWVQDGMARLAEVRSTEFLNRCGIVAKARCGHTGRQERGG